MIGAGIAYRVIFAMLLFPVELQRMPQPICKGPVSQRLSKIIFVSLFSSPVLANIEKNLCYCFNNVITTFTTILYVNITKPTEGDIACYTRLNK